MPARSADQWAYFKQICDGAIPPPAGMTKEQACEYVASQPSPEGLPQRAAEGIAVLGERGSDYLAGAYSNANLRVPVSGQAPDGAKAGK